MKLLWRYRYVIAGLAVAALGVALMLAGVLPKTDRAQGTQSDPNIGSSKYPAPKEVGGKPPTKNLAAVVDPAALPALTDVNDTCDGLKPGNHHVSLQEDGKGAQAFADMPTNPSTDTYKCAIRRAKAAGYYVVGNSVNCSEDTVKLLDPTSNTERSFRPFCMGVSQASDETCKVTLVVTDYAGNFLWDQQPDLSRLQNFRADGVRNDTAYAGC
jgi:hypothetical protein